MMQMFGDCAHLFLVKYGMALINPLTFRLYIFSHNCISDLGYTDYGEECSTTCGLVRSDLDEWNYWCKTVNATIGWDKCTPNISSKGPFIKDFSSNFSFLTPPTYPCLLFLLNNLI